MAKKKTVNENQPRSDAEPAADIEAQVLAAEDELLAAREALQAAEQRYGDLKSRAAQNDEFDEFSFGDMLDRSLDIVKKHPGLGVAAAAAVGFFLGRLFRRW